MNYTEKKEKKNEKWLKDCTALLLNTFAYNFIALFENYC